jgi:glutamyl-tRNA synthetase/glutamyl-Q tRNA(Asp) synthetase
VVIASGSERFIDGLLGEQHQGPSLQCGDLLLKDRMENWTYQFAVTVDDLDQTRMLGRDEPPTFVHHPLIWRQSGAKLSKANADTGIRELRAAGASPDSVLGQAAYLTGLIKTSRNLSSRDLAELFAPS